MGTTIVENVASCEGGRSAARREGQSRDDFFPEAAVLSLFMQSILAQPTLAAVLLRLQTCHSGKNLFTRK